MQSEGATEPMGKPQTGLGCWDGKLFHGQGSEGRGGNGLNPCAGRPHVLEGGVRGLRSPEGRSPNTCVPLCRPTPPARPSPALRKGSLKEQPYFFKEPQVATFLTALPPHTLQRSAVIPASNPPPSDRTGSAGRMGRVPAAQPWFLLSPLRSSKTAKKKKKTPTNQSSQSPPGPHGGACAGLGSPAARLPAPHRPARGSSRAALSRTSGTAWRRQRKTQALAFW